MFDMFLTILYSLDKNDKYETNKDEIAINLFTTTCSNRYSHSTDFKIIEMNFLYNFLYNFLLFLYKNLENHSDNTFVSHKTLISHSLQKYLLFISSYLY